MLPLRCAVRNSEAFVCGTQATATQRVPSTALSALKCTMESSLVLEELACSCDRSDPSSTAGVTFWDGQMGSIQTLLQSQGQSGNRMARISLQLRMQKAKKSMQAH